MSKGFKEQNRMSYGDGEESGVGPFDECMLRWQTHFKKEMEGKGEGKGYSTNEHHLGIGNPCGYSEKSGSGVQTGKGYGCGAGDGQGGRYCDGQ